MLDVAEPGERKRVPITKRQGLEASDRCMTEHESIPLPRCWLKTKQVADDGRVSARMSDEADTQIRVVDAPHRKLAIDRLDTALGKKQPASLADTRDEIAVGFAAEIGQSVPTLVRQFAALLGKRSVGFFARRTLPHRAANLPKPSVHHFAATKRAIQRCCSLARPFERRDQDFIERFGGEYLGHALGLTMSAFGQRRKVDIEPIDHPLGFAVSYKHYLHR